MKLQIPNLNTIHYNKPNFRGSANAIAYKYPPKNGQILERDIFQPKILKLPENNLIACSSKSLEEKINEAMDFENFKNIRFFSSLSDNEKIDLHKFLKNNSTDIPYFFAVLSDNKPMCILEYKEGQTDFLNKLKHDKLFSKKFNILQDKKDKDYTEVFIFNKRETLKTIERNKDIYTYRMGLKPNTSSRGIYKIIVSDNSPLMGVYNMTDITGITLGYPRYSSMIHELGMKTGALGKLAIKSPDYAYSQYLELLFENDSVYKNLDKKEVEKLAKLINKQAKTGAKNGEYDIYHFINYIDEPKEIQRIKSAAENMRKNFSIELLT